MFLSTYPIGQAFNLDYIVVLLCATITRAACRNYGNHFTISKTSLRPQRHYPGGFHFILRLSLIGNMVSILKEGSDRNRALFLFNDVRCTTIAKKIMGLAQNKKREKDILVCANTDIYIIQLNRSLKVKVT